MAGRLALRCQLRGLRIQLRGLRIQLRGLRIQLRGQLPQDERLRLRRGQLAQLPSAAPRSRRPAPPAALSARARSTKRRTYLVRRDLGPGPEDPAAGWNGGPKEPGRNNRV